MRGGRGAWPPGDPQDMPAPHIVPEWVAPLSSGAMPQSDFDDAETKLAELRDRADDPLAEHCSPTADALLTLDNAVLGELEWLKKVTTLNFQASLTSLLLGPP